MNNRNARSLIIHFSVFSIHYSLRYCKCPISRYATGFSAAALAVRASRRASLRTTFRAALPGCKRLKNAWI